MLIRMTQPSQPPYGSGSNSGSSGTPGWYGSSDAQNPYDSVPPHSSQDGGAQPNDGAGQPDSYDQWGQYRQQGQYGQYPVSPEGQSNATTSLVLGIIGLFAFGIILGPLAIYFAGKAERNGVQATAGKVLGWIVTILWGLFAIMIIFVVLFSILVAGASSGY